MKGNCPIYNYVRVMQRQADACIRKVIDYTENPDAFELYDGFLNKKSGMRTLEHPHPTFVRTP